MSRAEIRYIDGHPILDTWKDGAGHAELTPEFGTDVPPVCRPDRARREAIDRVAKAPQGFKPTKK